MYLQYLLVCLVILNMINQSFLTKIKYIGGVREALFSHNYEIIWGKREGFARVATEAKVVSHIQKYFS